jgi:hypothetical protein
MFALAFGGRETAFLSITQRLSEYRATITAHEPFSQFGHSRTSTTPGRLPLEQLE